VAAVDAPEFWDDRYARRGDEWELGRPAPALVEFMTSTPLPGRLVAVPGCGRGHDVRFLAGLRYEATGFDFAVAAVAEARALARGDGDRARFEQRDIFTLGRDYANAFDGVWEYTCFCAINPGRRREYAQTIAAILRPGGWFLACFFPVRRGGGGPPFPVAKAEVRRLLAPRFRIERALAPVRSVARRQGQEWMVLARKVGASG